MSINKTCLCAQTIGFSQMLLTQAAFGPYQLDGGCKPIPIGMCTLNNKGDSYGTRVQGIVCG